MVQGHFLALHKDGQCVVFSSAGLTVWLYVDVKGAGYDKRYEKDHARVEDSDD